MSLYRPADPRPCKAATIYRMHTVRLFRLRQPTERRRARPLQAVNRGYLSFSARRRRRRRPLPEAEKKWGFESISTFKRLSHTDCYTDILAESSAVSSAD